MSISLKSVLDRADLSAHLRLVLAALVALAALAGSAAAEPRAPHQALEQARDLVAEARRDCGGQVDTLSRVLCDGILRVGLRTDYHGFSYRDAQGTLTGFEVDLAAAIAGFLGVRLNSVAVEPKNRIPVLTTSGADLVIATMGHTRQRDANVGFVRPHYFSSRTVVIGPANSQVNGWEDLRSAGSVCLPLAAGTNIVFIQHHVRVLTFDTATALMDALNFGQCRFIAHDDTFFAKYLADPAWRARFAVRFGFGDLPWGIAVPPTGGERLRKVLSLLSAAWHIDGTFLALAERHPIPVTYLTEARQRLADPACAPKDGAIPTACLAQPVDTAIGDAPSVLAHWADWAETALRDWFGSAVDLSIFRRQATLSLITEGALYSIAMVVGSMITTVGFAFLFAELAGSRFLPPRLFARVVTEIGQSTPMPLLLFFGYVVAAGLTTYSALVALGTAMVMLGIYNGSYAGQALRDARASLPAGAGYRATLSVAWTQVMAFLINATKGAPAADMIGVPEFLGVVTDLTSHTGDRVALYIVLLVFYTTLVLIAIAAMAVIQSRLIHRVRRGS
jgi:ABC-type amino acid transport substrate-binding protein/ABC-type amino acid transport system permease subunit